MSTANLDNAISGWEAALDSDSASPQPTYTLNGKTVQRAEWRTALLDNIKNARRLRNARQPFVIRSVRRM